MASVGVLTAFPPVPPGKAGIANGSSLNDVTEMDCSSSAIDDLIKEVRPHLGWLQVQWVKHCIPKIPDPTVLDLQLVEVSQHQDKLLLSMCIQLGESFTGDGVCHSSVPLLGLLTPGCSP